MCINNEYTHTNTNKLRYESTRVLSLTASSSSFKVYFCDPIRSFGLPSHRFGCSSFIFVNVRPDLPNPKMPKMSSRVDC